MHNHWLAGLLPLPLSNGSWSIFLFLPFVCTSQHLFLSVYRDEMQIFPFPPQNVPNHQCGLQRRKKKKKKMLSFVKEPEQKHILLWYIWAAAFEVLSLLMLPVGPELQELALIAPRERGEWLRSTIFCVMRITVIWIQKYYQLKSVRAFQKLFPVPSVVWYQYALGWSSLLCKLSMFSFRVCAQLPLTFPTLILTYGSM